MNRFLQLDVNDKGRDFVIGDIHGKYDALMLGLKRIEFDFDKDRLIAVGDLIDRGTKNMECLKLVYNPWFYTVVGNHELMMADAVTHIPGGYFGGRNPMFFWTANGGHWYYTIDDSEITVLRDIYAPMIYNDLPLAIELVAENGKRIGITHAGLPKAWTWTQTRKHLECINNIQDTAAQNVLWTRDRIHKTGEVLDILGIDLLINGHTPTKKNRWRGNNVFIDLGTHNPYQLVPINVMDLFDEMQVADPNEKDWYKPA